MKSFFDDSTPSSPISPLTGLTMEEMLAMNDDVFFDCLERELESDFCSPSTSDSEEILAIQNKESRNLGSFPNLNLDFDESHQKILPSETCIPCNHHLFEPEISSSLGDDPHYPKPPDSSSNLLSGIAHNLPVCSYPPCKGLDENERLHILDEEVYEYHVPNTTTFLTLVPEPPEHHKSLLDFWNNPSPADESFHLCQTEPEYTIFQLVDKVSQVDIEDTYEDEVHYVGNSFNPDRRLDVYRAFLRHLNSSDFPYSIKQREVLSEIDNKISILHHLPNQRNEGVFTRYQSEELELQSELDLLMDLFADTDYQPVSSTLINRHVAAMICELEFWIERNPMIHIIIPGKLPFFVDPAAYLISKLENAFPNATEEKIEAAFFARRKESHVKLAQLFSQSKFPFTSSQKLDIKEISEAVLHTNGDPDSKEEKEFLNVIGKLIYNLTFEDQGKRDGISNPKKVKKEFNRLVSDLVDLGLEERKFLSEFERYSLHPADLIYNVVDLLYKSFIPRHILPQTRAPNSIPSLDESN